MFTDYHLSPVDENNIKVTNLPDLQNNFLAGAVWDSETQNAYYIDFVSPSGTNSVYRYDYTTQQTYAAAIPGEINPSFLWPVKGCNNTFIIGLDGVIKLLHWDGVSPAATVIRPILTEYGHMNYFMVDRAGRLYFGTLNGTILCSAPPEFSMYRYSKGSITKIFQNLTTTMGLAIDYKRNKFYHADTCRYQIVELDYDPSTGDICEYFPLLDQKTKFLNETFSFKVTVELYLTSKTLVYFHIRLFLV